WSQALFGFFVRLELVGVDLAGAFTGDGRDLVGNAPELLGADRQRRRLILGRGRRVGDTALGACLPSRERPIHLFVRDHGSDITAIAPDGPAKSRRINV